MGYFSFFFSKLRFVTFPTRFLIFHSTQPVLTSKIEVAVDPLMFRFKKSVCVPFYSKHVESRGKANVKFLNICKKYPPFFLSFFFPNEIPKFLLTSVISLPTKIIHEF